MTHLILVHSSLTYAVAKKIIALESWSIDSVRLVIDRNFPTSEEAGQTIDISDIEINPLRWRKRREFFMIWKKNTRSIKTLDQILHSLGSEYVVVLPHLQNLKYYALCSYKDCKGYYLMEEGVLSYADEVNSDSIIKKLKKFILKMIYRILYNSRIPPLPTNFSADRTYLGAFSITEHSFPSLSGKKMIPYPFSYEPKLSHFRNVLVLGPYFEFGQLSMEIELKGLEALFNYFIKNEIFEVHYKFHPAQLEQNHSPALIRDLMKKYEIGIRFNELRPDISLENIAVSSKADFYLATSSTAIYTVDIGRRVYSYANFLLKFRPEFSSVLESMPKATRERMIFLDL